MAEGTATSMGQQRKDQRRIVRNAHDEHVVRPDEKSEEEAMATLDEKSDGGWWKPKTRLREKVLMTSEITPMPGRIMM